MYAVNDIQNLLRNPPHHFQFDKTEISVRGIFKLTKPPKHYYGYGRLEMPGSPETYLKVKMTQAFAIELEHWNGIEIVLKGTLSQRYIQSSVELALFVTEYEGAVQDHDHTFDDFVSMVRQRATLKGAKRPLVSQALKQKLQTGNAPRLCLIFPHNTQVQTEFWNALSDAKRFYRFTLKKASFAKAGTVVMAINEGNAEGCDAICLIRGGGSGLGYLDNPILLEAIVDSETPVITAVGHGEDNLHIKNLAGFSVDTPTALGAFLRDIAYKNTQTLTPTRAKPSGYYSGYRSHGPNHYRPTSYAHNTINVPGTYCESPDYVAPKKVEAHRPGIEEINERCVDSRYPESYAKREHFERVFNQNDRETVNRDKEMSQILMTILGLFVVLIVFVSFVK